MSSDKDNHRKDKPKMKMKKDKCNTIHGFKNNIPNFEEQAEEMTRI